MNNKTILLLMLGAVAAATLSVQLGQFHLAYVAQNDADACQEAFVRLAKATAPALTIEARQAASEQFESKCNQAAAMTRAASASLTR